MSDKKVVKKVQKKIVQKKQPPRVSTSSYSTRPKISRQYEAPKWSLGWQGPSKDEFKNNSSFMKYHNSSSVMIGDKSLVFEQNNKKDMMRKTRTEEFNAKLPTYDPKMANRSQIVFGEQKPDFSKKSNVVSSPTRVPPGGKSQIIFG